MSHPTNFSLSLSDWHPRALDITMNVLQTGSWLGGIWGLYILLGMVGNNLDSTQWGIRQRLVATLAFVIWVITILDKVHRQLIIKISQKLLPAVFVLGRCAVPPPDRPAKTQCGRPR